MWWQRESSPEVEAALARVRIFSALARRDLQKLASKCQLRHFEAGDSILEEGSIGLGLFIITAGRVEVFRIHDGRKVVLAVLGAGNVLGEMALLDDQPRSASAVALEDTEYLLLTREGFRTLVKRHPRIALPIVAPLARRMRDQNRRRTDAAGSTTTTGPPPAGGTFESLPLEAAAAPTDTGPPETQPQAPAGDTGGRPEPDVLRAPYALVMTGAVGFGESVRLCEVFLRSLDESSGLAGGRPMSEVVRDLPEHLADAGRSSWEQGRRLPSKLLDVFRDHLWSDWREEDPD